MQPNKNIFRRFEFLEGLPGLSMAGVPFFFASFAKSSSIVSIFGLGLSVDGADRPFQFFDFLISDSGFQVVQMSDFPKIPGSEATFMKKENKPIQISLEIESKHTRNDCPRSP